MNFEKYFRKLADDGEPVGTLDLVAQRTLGVLSPLYASGAVISRILYGTGLREQKKLPVPVLSIGNITMGGTGKTPFAKELVGRLERMGYKPGLVARGYGREDEDRLVVVHDGKRLRTDTTQGGDEPVLLARSLGHTPIAVCSDRFRAGMVLIRKFGCDAIILDDGFQHHRLDRQGDVVLVDTMRLPSRLSVFPRGSLREPVGGLSRAHLIVLTRWDQADRPKATYREVQSHAPGVPIVRTRMVLYGAVRVGTSESIPLDQLKGMKVIALCGVGNPESFRKSLGEAGAKVIKMKTLPDHGKFPQRLLENCERLREKKRADAVIVTEKDAVKIQEGDQIPGSLLALKVRVEFLSSREEDLAHRIIQARLRAGGTRRLLGR